MKKIILILLMILLCACGTKTPTSDSLNNQNEATDSQKLVNDDKEESTTRELKQLDTKYDVIVIGAGPAGLVMASVAAQNELKVLLIEKTDKIGGTLNDVLTPLIVTNSQFQKNAKVNDSSDKLKDDLLILSKQSNNDLVDVFAKNVGSTINWLEKNGITLNQKPGLIHSFQYNTDRLATLTLDKKALVNQFSNILKNAKVEVMLNTEVTDFIKNEKGVVGVNIKKSDGEFGVRSKTVVIATGSYGQTLNKYSGEQPIPYCGLKTNTDSNLVEKLFNYNLPALEWGGLDVSLYGQFESEQRAKLSDMPSLNAILNGGALLINQNGERFVNELGAQYRYSDLLMEKKNSQYYLLLDQNALNAYRNIDNSEITTYSDLKDLATKNKISEVVLKATIDRYNGFVKSGVDQDYGRPKQYLNSFGAGEYALIKLNMCYTHGLGGLKVSKAFEVLDANGKDIPGLFAIGGITTGVFGKYGIEGGSLSWAFVSGYQAASEIAEMIVK